jgi:outer membrane protein TolC
VAEARDQVAAADAAGRPTLSADFTAGQYARELGSRDNFGALLNLRIPLYQGGSEDAEIAQARARLRDREAELRLRSAQIRQLTMELIRHLDNQRVARESARVRLRYRDRYLDRARARYELEMETTLGDSFTRMTEAQWLAEKIEFDIALTWARLKALAKGPIPEPVVQETLP